MFSADEVQPLSHSKVAGDQYFSEQRDVPARRPVSAGHAARFPGRRPQSQHPNNVTPRKVIFWSCPGFVDGDGRSAKLWT